MLHDNTKSRSLDIEEYKIKYDNVKRNLGENHPHTLTYLYNLAIICETNGHFEDAIDAYKDCYRKMQLRSKENDNEIQNILNSLGILYCKMGDYKKAIQYHKECYKKRKKVLGDNNILTLKSLNNIAIVYEECGDYQKALDLHQKCYDIRKELLNEIQNDILNSLNNLAIVHGKLRHYSIENNLLKKCYELRKTKSSKNDIKTLNTLNNLSISFGHLENYHEALNIAQYCYDKMKKIDEMDPMTLGCLNNLAICHKNLGDYNIALKLHKECYRKRVRILGEEHYDSLNSILNLSDLFYILKKYDETYYHLKKYFKSFNTFLNNISIIKDNKTLKIFLDSFIHAYDLLTKLIFQNNDIISAKLQKKDYDILLKYKSIIYDIEYAKTSNIHIDGNLLNNISTHNIQSRLNNNELLLSYHQLDDNHYGLMLISIYSIEIVFINVRDANFKNLVEPVKSHLHNINKILIFPDQNLYEVSLDKYFPDKKVSYILTLQQLVNSNQYEIHSNDSNVAFVYPDFSLNMDDGISKNRSHQGVLIGSLIESLYLKQCFGDKINIYEKNSANKYNFKLVDSPHLLHVSTHSGYKNSNTDDPMNDYVLYLAGSNLNQNDETYGAGYITSNEIRNMNLVGTELVVLSACSTGKGVPLQSEGIYGLRRAFELAGAKNIMVTLENVDDYNTAIFMKVFYRELKKSHKIFESFANTKRYLEKYGIQEMKELLIDLEKIKDKLNDNLYYLAVHKNIEQKINDSEERGYLIKGNMQKEEWDEYIMQGLIRE